MKVRTQNVKPVIKRTLLLSLMLFYLGAVCQDNHGVVARYTFNNGEAVNELSGKKAKAVGVVYTNDRFGNQASACFFQGSPESYLNLGSGSELKNQKASISLWVFIEDIAYAGKGYDYNPFILTKNGFLNEQGRNDDFYEAYSIGYNYDSKKVSVATSQSNLRQIALTTPDIQSIREWHHIVLTYDDDTVCLYINGSLAAASAKKFTTYFSPTDSVMLGNSANQKNERYLHGIIDDVVFYNRVISPTEVYGLYTAPDPNKLNALLKWVYWAITLGIVIVLIIWISLRRYKKQLEKREETNRINARLNELETRAIRAQMNPHFMFNSLNTLQRFILEEDITNAHAYLIKFSKLLRKLLESSTADTISLKEEIEILSTYVEIEKMRFDNAFDFSVRAEINNTADLYIPFMLVQPFVENAIWHGLMPKKDNRRLQVTFTELGENHILCEVDDNGVGRFQTTGQKDPLKQKSMAIDFIKQRLEIIGKVSGIKGSLSIIDKMENGQAAGTLVKIIIPIKK